MRCERCGKDIHIYDTCNYCSKKICNDCIKSSKRITGTERAFICKGCWSSMKSRKVYKRIIVRQAY